MIVMFFDGRYLKHFNDDGFAEANANGLSTLG
jgi:hypothetical protein